MKIKTNRSVIISRSDFDKKMFTEINCYKKVYYVFKFLKAH